MPENDRSYVGFFDYCFGEELDESIGRKHEIIQIIITFLSVCDTEDSCMSSVSLFTVRDDNREIKGYYVKCQIMETTVPLANVKLGTLLNPPKVA